MSFSAHIDNKKKDMLILGKGPTQRLERTLTAEEMYSINFTETTMFKLTLQWSITDLMVMFYDFSVAHDAIIADAILDIHKYLMKKNGMI